MKIKLKSLTLTNFKGIKNLIVPLVNHQTSIFGENAAGKTTVFDAFTWLFFGKDSSDRKDFEMKPIDKDGNTSQKIDVEVSAIIDVDGKEIEVKKVLQEKWVKKRGDLTPVFTGNENLFYWNDVPLQLKQYQEKISELINEDIFKLITNPLYFNSLKWQDRRSVLLQIAGEITNAELIAGNKDFAPLAKILSDKTLEEYKREVAAKKKKIKDDLQSIPTRIDEINRNLPEAADFEALRKTATEKDRAIAKIDTALQDATKVMEGAYEAKRKEQNDLHELKTKASNLKNDVRSKFLDAHNQRKANIAALEADKRKVEMQINSLKDNATAKNNAIESLNNDLVKLREEWAIENKKEIVFDESEFVCPACKRDLEADNVEASKTTLVANFNTTKANKLTAIVKKSDDIKAKIATLQTTIEKDTYDLKLEEGQLYSIDNSLGIAELEHQNITTNSEAEFIKELDANAEYASLIANITAKEAQVENPVEATDNSHLQEQKANLKIELDAIKRQLNDEETIKKGNDRRKQLEADEKTLAQELADLEGSEYLAEQFTKAKMDTLVQRINGRFKYVTFKMFDTQINGGEIECCDTLVNGVPFTDANNAARINAGLDIINTLCEHYGAYAPIFIDNRESVNQLIDCNSQVVNLIVSTDKKLRVA